MGYLKLETFAPTKYSKHFSRNVSPHLGLLSYVVPLSSCLPVWCLGWAQCMGFPPYSVIKEEETECIVPGTCIELLVNFSYTVMNFHGLMLDRYSFCATCAGLCRQRHSSWEAAIQKKRICFFFPGFVYQNVPTSTSCLQSQQVYMCTLNLPASSAPGCLF